ncbi:MAG TPA: hypothetical protein VGB37_15065 [Candidatus Lokiarchaeia archaeon]
MDIMVLVGAIFETCILFIGILLLLLILKRYFEKKNKLTLYLFTIFLNLIIATFFSMLSKVIVLTTNIDYVYNQPNIEYPNTPYYWIVLRIVDFRITMIFVIIGSLLSYLLEKNIFEEKVKKYYGFFVYIFSIYSIFFAIFVYVRGNTLLDAINFLNAVIIMSVVYIPFMINCYRLYKAINDIAMKKGFLSLSLMSLSFISILFCILLDRITILLEMSNGFTVFYFMAWSFVIVGFLCAYMGYIKPKTR